LRVKLRFTDAYLRDGQQPRRNITLVRLPPYAPELNPIENVWEYLRGNKLASPCSKAMTTSSIHPAPPGASSPTIPNASPQSHPELG
jgi:hypothetical protein